MPTMLLTAAVVFVAMRNEPVAPAAIFVDPELENVRRSPLTNERLPGRVTEAAGLPRVQVVPLYQSTCTRFAPLGKVTLVRPVTTR